jgi:hypothetical protein
MNCFKKHGNAQAHININLHKLENWLTTWHLMMVPQKCSYIIFSKYHGAESPKMKLLLFKTKLDINNSPTFLGIHFDKALSFKNQIEYLQETCLNRLTYLKIVAKRSYGLSSKTLNQQYDPY